MPEPRTDQTPGTRTKPGPRVLFLGHDLTEHENPYCEKCATKWGKQLLKTSCVCTGHVSLMFRPPG